MLNAMRKLSVGLVLLAIAFAACTQPAGTGNSGGNGGNGNGGGNAGAVSGTFNAATGLQLQTTGIQLTVPVNANPSNTTITVTPLSETELANSGLPSGNGFELGVRLEPSGTTFDVAVQVTVELSTATELAELAVLTFDEALQAWVDSGIRATVIDNGSKAQFEVTHFTDYDVWNPPVPRGTVAIGADEIVAGTGFFEGQPFNTFPSPQAATASLTYSPFGNLFALALIQVDATNPVTGDHITLSAGLHASENRMMEGGAVLGLITPAGDLGGPSLYEDATGFPKPVAGVMFLRKSATQWIVDVYAHYEGGLIFGQASGDLGG